jgi:hypothetical protein
MYGEDPETGEGYGEMVCLYESQVIVSRETLAALVDTLSPEAAAKALTWAQMHEVNEVLGS